MTARTSVVGHISEKAGKSELAVRSSGFACAEVDWCHDLANLSECKESPYIFGRLESCSPWVVVHAVLTPTDSAAGFGATVWRTRRAGRRSR